MRAMLLSGVLVMCIVSCSSEEGDAVIIEGDEADAGTTLLDPEYTKDSITSSSELDSKKEFDPEKWLNEFQNGSRAFDFYARFTEPFWTIYFVNDKVLFQDIDKPAQLYKADERFDPDMKIQTIHFSNNGRVWELIIEKKPGSDGMSELNYPYSTTLNKTYVGGGGETMVREE